MAVACPSCLIAVACALCQQRTSGVSSRVCESASPQSAEYIRPTLENMIKVEQFIELSSIRAICHSSAVDLQLLQSVCVCVCVDQLGYVCGLTLC